MDLGILLTDCKKQGVELSVNDGNLDVSFDTMPSDELIAQLKAHKLALVEFISQLNSSSDDGSNDDSSNDSSAVNPIVAVDRAQALALSPAQARLWMINQIEGGSAQYNMPSAMTIEGPFCVDTVSRAFGAIVNRHESLRTVFVNQNDEQSDDQNDEQNDKQSADTSPQVRQKIVEAVSFTLEFEDISQLDASGRQHAIDGAIALEGSHIFDLSNDLLLRAKVLKCAALEHVLIVNMHHIASDGWSIGVLTAELNHFYQQFGGHKVNPLPDLSLQYADFAQWQLAQQQSTATKKSFDYWQQQLSGLPQTHQLPLDYPRSAQQTFNGARIEQTINSELTKNLAQLAQSHSATLFMLLQTAFTVLLNRYSGENDIVMGTPIAGRTDPILEPLIGFFVNTLVLRSNTDGGRSFIEQLATNKQMLTAAFDNQNVQFEQLVEKLNPQRSMAHNPLFQVMFVMQNATEGQLQWPDLTVSSLTAPKPTIRFDLELKIYPIDGQLTLHWLYNRDLFKPASIERMSNNFAVLLDAIVKNPQQSIQALPILHQQETQLLMQWNETQVDFNQDVTLHHLFIEQVTKTPDAIAIVDQYGQLSYQALYLQSVAICQQLQAINLAPEELVGVRMNKGRDQVAATLGIMMAGGAYLPMEHFWPDERCATVVTAANCRWVLIDNSAYTISDCDAEHFYPALSDTLSSSCPKSNSAPDTTAGATSSATSSLPTAQQWLADTRNDIDTQRLAYVIFTSGSTGKPKGVAIEHCSAVNTLVDMNWQYNVTENDRVLAISALSFDLSVYDIFGLLAVGGQVVFPDDLLTNDPAHWLQMVEQHQITLWDTTPASAVLIAEQLEQLGRPSSASIRHFVLSGDWIPPNLPKRLWQVFEGAKVHSQGGATEGSIWSIHYPIEHDTSHLKSIPYGRPLSNQRFFILNQEDQLCPVGVIGQLHIGGIGVAREYYNDDIRTKASYFYHQGLQQKLYRTGDLGRLQVDAQGKPDTIEFIGRVDNQVKVRGYRIEPGEIEATINQHQDVTTSLILPVGDSSEQRQLAAYICPQPDYLDTQARALAQAQVQQWTDIFDDAYGDEQPQDTKAQSIAQSIAQSAAPKEAQTAAADTNLKGWNSSYSGQAIQSEQMLEWIDGTVARILDCKTAGKTADRPNRILEIGCGTGLLLYRYAPHFETVHALDISQMALTSIKQQCDSKGWHHIHLHRADALSLSQLDIGQFDVIVINSVVQYFPNRRYLQEVITTASQLLSETGKLFIGDVRNLDLLDAHNSAVARDKLSQVESVKTLAANVQYAVQQEKELLISPSWFAQLPQLLNHVSQFDIMVKRGMYNNEMLRYRYDVVLHRHQASSPAPTISWLQWGDDLCTDEALKSQLSTSSEQLIGIAGYPNERVSKDLWLADGLKSWHSDFQIDPTQVNAQGVDEAGEALEQLLQWAEQQGWQAVATWSGVDAQQSGQPSSQSSGQANSQATTTSALGCVDLIFTRNGFNLNSNDLDSNDLNNQPLHVPIVAKAPYRQKIHTNYPQLSRLATPLTEQLRNHLTQTLPNYMLPSYYVYLERLPLSANGKIDRKALPVPASEQFDRGEYIAPSNDIERTLCQLCEQILDLEAVGIEDDFFAIGGHSLLATRLLSAINDKLGISLAVRQIFATPTMGQLANIIDANLAENTQVVARIEKAAQAQSYPLSFAQQRLWFIDQMEGASARYNIAGSFELAGQLNRDALTESIKLIVARHDVLRAVYRQQDGQPRQIIRDNVATPITYGAINSTIDKELERAIAKVTRQPFDLHNDTPLRFAVFELTANRFVVAYAMHHIASDGWSMSRLVEELSHNYQYLTGYSSKNSSNVKQPLAPLAIQYQDYAIWQRDFLTDDELERQLTFWTDSLQGLPERHDLPLDKPRPAVQSFAGGKHQITLTTQLSAHLQQLAKSQNATLFMLLHSAFCVLLSRYSGQSDIVIGSAIAGRNQTAVEPLIGFFVNNLVLRSHCEPTLRFNQLLQQNRQFILDAFAHQHLPFELLVEKLQPTRNLSFSPLFQVMLILQNIDEVPLDMPGLTMTPRSNADSSAKFDLELNVIEYPDKLVMQFSYNSDLFVAQTITRMAQNFTVLLQGIVDNPQGTISLLPIISEVERQQQLVKTYQPNAPKASKQAESARPPAELIEKLPINLAQKFEQAAANFSANTAIQHNGRNISYEQLNRRANQLAHLLIATGVKNGEFVGLCLNREPDIIVAILAILKAGGAYVPIDPNAPVERVNHMLNDASVRVMVSQTSVLNSLAIEQLATNQANGAPATQIIDLEDSNAGENAGENRLENQAQTNPQLPIARNDLAYLIYTSGSTGLPKGVMIEHGALVDAISCDIDIFDVQATSRMLHLVSFNFDAATSHLFFTLCAGGTLYLYNYQQEALDIMTFAQRHDITHMAVTASMLAAQEKIPLPQLKTLIVGGEHCSESVSELWSADRNFFNVYGPTETTITATYADYSDEQQRHTIGKSLPHANTYVLDGQQQLLPIGAVGELYIGGTGVSRGYLNRPELTEQVFLPDIFASQAGAKMYKTGDLVRYNAAGYLTFIGRTDHQVKVRGFRIELSEIEAQLNALTDIASNVVIAASLSTNLTTNLSTNLTAPAQATANDKQLIAYVVLNPTVQSQSGCHDHSLQLAAINEQLAQVLPEYMIPSQMIVLEQMPLNINGKIDRQALPEPAALSQTTRSYIAPRNALETTMAEIWQNLLGVEQVSIDDNFFSIGGHSLLATRVLAQIRQQLNQTLTLKCLFEHPTVATFCQALSEQAKPQQLPAISCAPTQADIPLSYAQQRLWFINELEGSSSQYNIPAALQLDGQLDVAQLELAFKHIIERHQVLRTRFIKAADGTPKQQVLKDWHFTLPVQSCEDYRLEMVKHATAPFDLSQELMLKAKLLKLSEQQHVLLLNIHHIAADGWSIGLLIDELNKLYSNIKINDKENRQLAPLTVQYGDYAHWQRQHLTPNALQQPLDYWQQQLSDLPPVHNLPTDRPRPARQSYRGQMHRQVLDSAMTSQLQALTQQQDGTLFMVLHSALSTLFHCYSGDKDIVIGTPVAGRHEVAIEQLIGFFTNTLVLRSDFSQDESESKSESLSFNDIMQRNRTTVLDGLNHQQLPFEMLVEKLNPERSLSHNPLFQVMLVLQNNQMAAPQLAALKFSPITPEVTSTQFDLNLNINEIDGKLYVNWQYACDLFEQATIARMAEHFEQILQAFIDTPEQPLSDLVLAADPQLNQWQHGPSIELPHQHLVALFEHRVNQTPDAIAIMHQHNMSYQELDKRANYHAHKLVEQGVKQGDIVCLYCHRSIDMFVALLAILKAGAAYMPIDSTLPTGLISARLNLAKPKAALIGQSLTTKSNELFGAHIPQSNCITMSEQQSDSRLNLPLSPQCSAYVLFTSGSTGVAKGIDMGHGALVNFICAMQADCPALTLTGKTLQFSSIGFDMSFADAFIAFASGSALQLIDEPLKADVAALCQLINTQQLTTLNLPYAMLQAICEYCNDSNITLPSVQVMLSTAEQLKVTTQIVQYFARHLQQHQCRPVLVNNYGPTETQVVTALTLEGQPQNWPALPSIGKPIANTRCLILDKQGNKVPPGIYGELYFGGANLAKGYLNQPALTNTRFIIHGEQRLYRSGDWARWCEDGTIEYQGRIDNQVQLRGFRVELGDIEACLLRHPSAEKAIVLVINQQLCAYIESANAESQTQAAELKSQCQLTLPDYMVPHHFCLLTEFPLNTNGKVDRGALPTPQIDHDDTQVPETDTEIQLANIWQALLTVEGQIYRHDNFFALGGHSLLVTRLSSAVQSRWQITLPVSTVFEQQQLSALALWLDEQQLLIRGVSITTDNASTNNSHNDSDIDSASSAASEDEWEF